MSEQFDFIDEQLNPLDSVEDVLSDHNWSFNRMNDDELTVEISGKSSQYSLYFVWQDDMSALQMCCQFDTKIPENNSTAASTALRSINETMWMGHFDIPKETHMPIFRHTGIFKGMEPQGLKDSLQSIVDIALIQCERFQPVFQLLASANDIQNENLSLALMETKGES